MKYPYIAKNSVIKTEISFAGGLLSCAKSKNQIPHILEHMILAKITPDSSFLKNGKTNNFYTSFSVESVVSKHDDNLQKLIYALSSPDFDEAELDRQKKIIKNELLLQKDNRSRDLFDKIILKQNESFLTLDEQIESLENINLIDIEDYYKEFFIIENISFLTSGDCDTQNRINKIITSADFKKGKKYIFEKKII